MKILLVEDETRLAEAIAASLTKKGIAVDHTALLEDAIELAQQQTYDAIVLDRRLPDGDGITFIPWLRSSSVVTPVIVLTARNEPKERVAGLDLGADDYLGKPFLMEELFARLRAVMRRPSALAEPSIVLGRMTVDPIRMDVMVGELQLDLPRRELMVLVTLAKRKGKTVLRSVLETEIYNYEETIQSNALDAHVSRLRKRLADADAGVSIHNIRGVGYLLKEH
jgi:DNA-binding response OmpR family regulator